MSERKTFNSMILIRDQAELTLALLKQDQAQVDNMILKAGEAEPTSSRMSWLKVLRGMRRRIEGEITATEAVLHETRRWTRFPQRLKD